ncbi:hypothetical protein O181_027389 [Austropuccinia psidii MF-1]|uniref:Uncharacterized protein n=1 Tax=Austropuccinia psidii MF-1 TaxID=1389203 RepID=A0A9Q3H2K3_9BASI|nr:hypothetical protein [Austropuccinia psidii MF-1]
MYHSVLVSLSKFSPFPIHSFSKILYFYGTGRSAHSTQSVGPLGPFWPKFNEAKRSQGGGPPAPKARCISNHKWAHLSPILAPDPKNSKLAKRTPGPRLATGSHQRPRALFQQGFPSTQGKTFPSSMYTVPKDPGMVHIWYKIPLFTIFAQQSNGDVFRTQLFNSNTSPQIHHPFQRRTFSVIQSCNRWWLPEDHSRPRPPGPVGVGLLLHLRIVQRVI